MVPDISRGSRTYGLLAYLYGSGRRDEHVDPHQVASFDGFAPDPGRDPVATLAQLTAVLDLRVNQLGPRKPKKHVWHCPVRAAPGDRKLSDEEWGEVARRVVVAASLAQPEDPDGCRWVAVRHAEDHIHILATIVRGDLRQARLNNDAARVQAECRRIEQDMGLRQLNAGDGTAATRPTSAERIKAERTGRAEPPRLVLRDMVRLAVAGAATEEEFFGRLELAGLLVKRRLAPSGDVLGYSVADPGDRTGAGEPVWYSGSTLASDLSLPRIRRRLGAGPVADLAEQPTDGRGQTAAISSRRASAAARARRAAAGVVEDALEVLDHGPEEQAASYWVGTAEILDAFAATSPAGTRAELLAAARAFERASRSHVRAERADLRSVRTAARHILYAGPATGRGEDGEAALMLLSALFLLVMAADRWHSARGQAQQAAAARTTAAHLRAAYTATAARPLAILATRGRNLPEPVRNRHARTICEVLPAAARETETTGTDALAATLAEAEAAGHDPQALLEQASRLRELDTAESVTAVMVWRIRRLADLPAARRPVGESSAATPPAPRSTSASPRSRR
ncbi:relaxase/mobilization nuclease domain-containing protein [Peterkaempfera griseoplana]|uniref:relaxase/mobilization nuclease domain-containing protein n=1 Tax=Peterkaempfera griseoplana TaxID=66896 RepID=UPI0006E3E55D|nr:hypothetical protein [Peterkaempfera griseoplana]